MTGIAENEDIGRRLILGSPIEVNQNIRAELIASDVQALRVGLA